MKPLDALDCHILNILQDDSMISVKDIASQIGLSFTPTYERMKSLKQRGVIQKYVAVVDREKVGYHIMSYCNVTLKDHSPERFKEFEEKISEENQVLEVLSLSGTYDYMLKIIAKDIKDYNEIITKLTGKIPNIGQYHSNIVLSVSKEESKIVFQK